MDGLKEWEQNEIVNKGQRDGLNSVFSIPPDPLVHFRKLGV
jgi:hypothetical protein